jgi:hypothetical protein
VAFVVVRHHERAYATVAATSAAAIDGHRRLFPGISGDGAAPPNEVVLTTFGWGVVGHVVGGGVVSVAFEQAGNVVVIPAQKVMVSLTIVATN